MNLAIPTGITGAATRTVTAADTAPALGSGDVDVFGTPAVVALCEQAASAAVIGRLPPGHTSVGVHVAVDHLAPTLAGVTVEAVATLEEVNGRTLVFSVEVSDPAGTVARCHHRRVVVERDRFMWTATERGDGPGP